MKANHFKPWHLLIVFLLQHNRPHKGTLFLKSKQIPYFYLRPGKRRELWKHISECLEARGQLRHLRIDIIYCSHGPMLAQAGEKNMHANSYKAVSIFLSPRPDCTAGKAMKGILCF